MAGKWLMRRPEHTPLFRAVGTPANLTPGHHWFGSERRVLSNNKEVVDKSTAYIESRRRQSAAYLGLVEERIRIAQKFAELSDLPYCLNEEQRTRKHARDLAEHKRRLERLQAAYELRLLIARSEAELARLKEIGVRASRNLEAARRVKQSEIDRWWAEAEARKNNAIAERVETAADLERADSAGSSGAGSIQRAIDLAVLDHEIELERQRGNEAAVLALMNLRARLRASS